MNRLITSIVFGILVIGLISCGSNSQHPGLEFAPNMYVSEPLDPLSQTKNAEFPYNENNMTMREPVKGSIARGKMPYNVEIDDLETAALILNPIKLTEEVLADGEVLYGRFCQHCHGETGMGDGLVGQKYAGVPKYTSRAIKDKTMGHLFHVITVGKGRMNGHASQLSTDERWTIAHYVQTLQKQ